MTPEQLVAASPWVVAVYTIIVVGMSIFSLWLGWRQATVKRDTARMAETLQRIEVLLRDGR